MTEKEFAKLLVKLNILETAKTEGLERTKELIEKTLKGKLKEVYLEVFDEILTKS